MIFPELCGRAPLGPICRLRAFQVQWPVMKVMNTFAARYSLIPAFLERRP